MELIRRPGFVASPRIIVPVIILIVLLILIASLGSGDVSTEHLAATVVVGVALLALFAFLAILSRAHSRGEDLQ
jgi:hypothetical protein